MRRGEAEEEAPVQTAAAVQFAPRSRAQVLASCAARKAVLASTGFDETAPPELNGDVEQVAEYADAYEQAYERFAREAKAPDVARPAAAAGAKERVGVKRKSTDKEGLPGLVANLKGQGSPLSRAVYSAVRTKYAVTDEELAVAVEAAYVAEEYVFTRAEWTTAWEDTGRVEADKCYKTAQYNVRDKLKSELLHAHGGEFSPSPPPPHVSVHDTHSALHSGTGAKGHWRGGEGAKLGPGLLLHTRVDGAAG